MENPASWIFRHISSLTQPLGKADSSLLKQFGMTSRLN